ncbi:uncharacterized protein LOC128184974 [Crassostrea angulata]|uniref:NADH dehydrogenase [ubiquinone] 1 beta subcomplex subunit 4 n=2 Tax=Magallana gigas TaxID=29159 RepID=A0A8W8J6W2_MAGGI|nr:uncharacterized protein LOC105318240 [Crassostrea gigas]XP_052710593.1 uncharacterized protein LOC128184974 [Crassostrea angulata]
MSGERAWDPWKTFKLSDAERDLIDRRRQTKDRFRIEFNKIYTDPRKDYVLDHNFERWHAYRNNHLQLMNIWHKSNVIGGLLYCTIPCITIAVLWKRAVDKRDRQIMSGELTWRDRIRGIGVLGTTT